MWVNARTDEEGEGAGAGTARPTTSRGWAQSNLGGMACAFLGSRGPQWIKTTVNAQKSQMATGRRRNALGESKTYAFWLFLC